MTKTSRTFIGRVAGVIAVAGVFLVPIAFGSSEPIWRPLASAPAPRQEVSYVALGGNLYLAAGNSRSQERYDPETDQWESRADLPASFDGVDHVHGVAVGGRIVYIGGLSKWEYPFPVIDAVAIYDPASNTFATGTPMPSPRAAGGVTAWRGTVIYAGGLGPNGSVARVDAYDPQTDKWTRLADMPRPRDHFQAAVVGDELYAIGGRDTFDSGGGSIGISEIASVDVLDLPSALAGLPSATWRADATSLPTLRSGHGVVAIGECIYVVGGESESAGPEGVTGSTESYDTGSGTWSELAPLWIPRHGIQAAAIGKEIYVAGGGTKAFDYSPTAAHETLDVSEHQPCKAIAPDEPPNPEDEPPPSPGDDPPPGTGSAVPGDPQSGPDGVGSPQPPVKVKRLEIRPRRVLQHAGADIVVVLSRSGRIHLRLPRHFRFSRWLPAGRNTLPLPIRPGGMPLPPGRYELIAQPRGQDTDRRIVRAGFVVVD